jgi:hypothetical protein
MFGLIPYRAGDPEVTTMIVNRISDEQREILNTCKYIIIFNTAEGGENFVKGASSRGGNIHIAGYNDEEIFKYELAYPMTIYGAYYKL